MKSISRSAVISRVGELRGRSSCARAVGLARVNVVGQATGIRLAKKRGRGATCNAVLV